MRTPVCTREKQTKSLKMMDRSTGGKRSLYRAASTHHRPTLPQGKLQSSTHSQSLSHTTSGREPRAEEKDPHSSSPPRYSALHSHIDRKSEHHQARAHGIDPASSPRRPPPPPSPRFPSTEHTLTLFLSSSSSDGDITPHHLTESHPPIHVIPSPRSQPLPESHPVLVVDAQTTVPALSGEVPVRALVGVAGVPTGSSANTELKVVRHSPRDSDFSGAVPSEPLPASQDMDWRRFTNSFVTPPTPVDKTTASGMAEEPTNGGEGGGGEGGAGRGGGRGGETDFPVVLKTAAKSGTEVSSVAKKSKKPQKGRLVPSRYMAAASSSNRRPPAPQASKAAKKPPTRPTRTVKPSSEKNKTSNFGLRSVSLTSQHKTPRYASPCPPSPLTPSNILTSTPIVPGFGGHTHLHPQDGSYLSGPSVVSGTASTSKGTAKNVSRVSESRASESRVSRTSQSANMELELWLSRLVQAAYLDVTSAKALRKQEEAAKSQLHQLWCAVEDQRRKNAQMEREIERLEREQALKNSLDIQLQGLDPVCGYLQEVGKSYGSMARALDTTRHELTVSGVAPVSEDQLLEELSQCEAVLGDTLAIIRNKIPVVSEFADSTEAVVTTLDQEFKEMNSCWEALARATRSQLHATSLLFEERQRTRASSSNTS